MLAPLDVQERGQAGTELSQRRQGPSAAPPGAKFRKLECAHGRPPSVLSTPPHCTAYRNSISGGRCESRAFRNVGMDVEALGDLDDRLLALDRLQGDLGLEGGRVVASWASWHGLSSSSVGCRGAVSPIGLSDFARPLLNEPARSNGATRPSSGGKRRAARNAEAMEERPLPTCSPAGSEEVQRSQQSRHRRPARSSSDPRAAWRSATHISCRRYSRFPDPDSSRRRIA